jgi:hypothetical protein
MNGVFWQTLSVIDSQHHTNDTGWFTDNEYSDSFNPDD